VAGCDIVSIISVRLIDQIEPMLDPFEAKFQTIKPPVNTGKSVIDCPNANIDIVNVQRHPIDALIDPA